MYAFAITILLYLFYHLLFIFLFCYYFMVLHNKNGALKWYLKNFIITVNKQLNSLYINTFHI